MHPAEWRLLLRTRGSYLRPFLSPLAAPEAVSALAACFLACLSLSPALAFQAPFQTESTFSVDDPGDAAIRAIGSYWQRENNIQTRLPQLQGLYRVSKTLEIDVSVPFQTDTQPSTGTHYALGSSSIEVCYRFFKPEDKSWLPSFGTCPQVYIPSAAPQYGIGTGYVHGYLPLIIEKDIGKWSLVGNVAVGINPGDGNRDYLFIGQSVTRELTEDWSIGGDIYFESSKSEGRKDTAAMELGAKYSIDKKQNIYLSVGRAFLNPENTDEFHSYFVYQITF
jgi:hypothetical protein